MIALVYAVLALVFAVLCSGCDKTETFPRIMFLLACTFWMVLAAVTVTA